MQGSFVARRRFLGLSVAAAVAAMWSSSARADSAMANLLGAANINPSYYFDSNIDSVNEATNVLAGVGSHAVKLELDQYDLNKTWSTSSKYAWNTPNWPALNGSTSLTSIAQTSYFSNVFSNPNINNYVMTTYSPNIPGGGDGTEYWLSGMTSTQKSAETTSFYNLTKYLLQTYAGTNKTFYLENWEGDWALRDPGRNTIPSPTAIQGMIDWFNARQLGINEARAAYGGSSNAKVYGTVEVNLVQDAMEGDVGGYATVTNDVLPFTTTDFASYSSYDTQQNTTGTYSYANAVAYIAAHLPSTAVNGQNTHSVYVGEFGLAEDSAGSARVNSMMNNVINTAKADGMPLALYWEVFSNELSNGVNTPPGNDGDNSAVKWFAFVKPDGTPATAWKTVRGLIATNDPAQATAGAVERNLHMAYASNFSAPGATLGSAWTTSTFGGAMSVGISNSQLQMTTVNGTNTPYGQATLNIDSVLGRGLGVGEYLQFTLNRANDIGTIGLSAFGLNHGSGAGAGAQTFEIYPNGTYGWTPVSYNPTNNTNPTYTFDTPNTTLGLRLVSADGRWATVDYYVNGSYSGSWLYHTTATALDSFSLLAQSNSTGSVFNFNNLTFYTTNGALGATNYKWDPARNGSGSGGAGTWDAGTTNNFYNGTSDVVWNYATMGDQVTFAGTGGTVTVAGAGVTASTMIFNSPNYVLTGGTITMLGNQTINATNGQVTINSIIAGSNGLTITGAGSVVLGASNTFSNGLYVNSSGTASFATDANLGAAGGQITLNGGTLNYTGTTAPTITRQINIGASGGTINLAQTAGTGKLVLNSTDQIQGSGNVTKTGPGWLTLYGSNSGTFTGNWNINGGVIEVDSTTILGSGSVTVNSGGEIASSSLTLSNAVTMAGGTIGADNGTGTFTGNINVTAASNVRLGNFWNTTSQSVNLSGNITGSGSLTTIPAAGAGSSTGTLTLSGSNSGWTGSVVAAVGTVSFSAGNNIGSGGITLNGGIVNYTGTAAPTLSGPLVINSGGGTLDLVNTGVTGKLGISGAVSGSGNVTLSGPGWLSLFGSGTFSGGWTVNAGVTELDNNSALGTGSITVNSAGELASSGKTLANNVTLAGGIIGADNSTGTFNGSLNITANSSVRLGDFWDTASQSVTLNGNITGSGSLTTIAASGTSGSTGTLTLGGNNSAWTGALVVNMGTLAFSAGNNIGTGGISVSNGATVTYTGTSAGTVSGPVVDGSGGAIFNVTNSGSSGKLTLSGTLSGTGSLTKTGAGWLILSGTNSSFTGPSTINAGVVEADTASALGTGSITVNTGGELASSGQTLTNAVTLAGGTIGADNTTGTYNGAVTVSASSNVRLGDYADTTSQSVNLGGTISGSGSLTTIPAAGAGSSTGALTLSGTNSSWTGALTINAGAVNFAFVNNLPTGGVTINGGTLSYTGTTVPTYAAPLAVASNGGTINLVNSAGTGKIVISSGISGSGAITKSGPGWLTLYGSGTSTGNWTVNGGAVEAGNATAMGSGSVTVNSGAEVSVDTTAVVNNPVTVNTGATISADFSTTNTGTYGGAITASGNFNVRLGNFWSTTSQNVTFNGALSGSGSLTTINAAGASSSTGTLILGGNNHNYTGAIAIPTGTVATSASAVGDNDALGTGAVTLSGGTLSLRGQTTPSGAGGTLAAVGASGYTIDTIYASTETSKYPSGNNTNNTLMDGNFSFFQNGYTPPAGSLNAGTSLTGGLTGTAITSATTNPLTGTHTPFTLQSFTAANDLQIAEGNTGVMTFTSPTAYANLEVLADSTWGADASPNLKITFTDGSTVNTTFHAYDWSIGTDPTRQGASVFGSTGVNRYGPTQAPGWDTNPFGMYETDINMTNIGGVDYSFKKVASLTFTADTSDGMGRGKTDIFAVTGSARAMASGGPNQSFNNDVNVTGNSTINIASSRNAYMRNLTIGTNTLTVTCSDNTTNPYSLNFASTTETGSPTFNVLNSTGGGHGTLNLNDGLTGFPTVAIAGGGSSSSASAARVFQDFSVISGTVAFPAHAADSAPDVTVLNSLTLKGSGSLDLNNNDLIVHDGNLATITCDITNGQGGAGLVSSSASSDPTGTEALAAVLNNNGDGQPIYSSFDNQSVGANDVLVKYATYGDTNLSGSVNAADITAVDNGYADHLSGWQNGDFNYDGVVDGSDFSLLDNAENQQTFAGQTFTANQIATPTSEIAGSAAVPEPTALGILAIGLTGMLRRKRRGR